jgi:site-specific recombinase XerD
MASIHKDKAKGHRVFWHLYLDDGHVKDKYKACRSKLALQSMLEEAGKLERLTRNRQATPHDLNHAFTIGLISRQELAMLVPEGTDTTDHYLQELRQDYETKSKATAASPHSHRENLSKADLIEEEFKATPITSITRERIEQFMAKRRAAGKSDTTVNHDLKALRKYLDIAVSKGLVRENIARAITLLPEQKNRIPRCLYPDEIERFVTKLSTMAYLLDGEIQFIAKVLLLTGLRRSELLKLTPDNIKLQLRQIHVLGKGKKNRIVGIHDDLMEELTARVKKGKILPKFDPSSVSHAIKKVIRAAELSEQLTLHSLRHSYITYLLAGGTPIGQVRDLAGHSSLEVTNRYTHALPSDVVLENCIRSPFK